MDYQQHLAEWETTCLNVAARVIRASHDLSAATTDQAGLEASRRLISIAQELWALGDEMGEASAHSVKVGR